MAWYATAWFWGFLVGILLFIVGILFYDYDRTRESSPPFWVWFLLALGAILILVSTLIYLVSEPSLIQRCCLPATL